MRRRVYVRHRGRVEHSVDSVRHEVGVSVDRNGEGGKGDERATTAGRGRRAMEQGHE